MIGITNIELSQAYLKLIPQLPSGKYIATAIILCPGENREKLCLMQCHVITLTPTFMSNKIHTKMRVYTLLTDERWGSGTEW